MRNALAGLLSTRPQNGASPGLATGGRSDASRAGAVAELRRVGDGLRKGERAEIGESMRKVPLPSNVQRVIVRLGFVR